jgi:hypothetical protein
METPALYIKIKGADALAALTKGQVIGAAKLKGGAALAKGAMLHGAEIEAEGLLATKHGIIATEFEGVFGGLTKGGACTAKGAAAKGAAATSGAAKASAAKAAAAKAAAAKGGGAGALWSSKSIGLGLGLGALGPILVLGALGLGAVGLYLYRRNKKLEGEDLGFDDDDVAIPTV